MKRDRLLLGRFAVALLSMVGLVWLATAINAWATTEASDEAGFLRRNLEGWTGVSFSCRSNPAESWMNQICDAARQHARFLAATANINFVDLGDGSLDAIARSVHAGNRPKYPLHLRFELLATSDHFRGIHGRIYASNFYVGAVDTGWPEEDMGAPRDGPSLKPKSGELVFWDREFIAAGEKSSDLQQAVISSAQILITEFLALLAEQKWN